MSALLWETARTIGRSRLGKSEPERIGCEYYGLISNIATCGRTNHYVGVERGWYHMLDHQSPNECQETSYMLDGVLRGRPEVRRPGRKCCP